MSKEPSAPFFPGPTAPVVGARQSRPRTLVLALGLGGVGCLGVIVLVVVLVLSFVHTAAANCPPKDFPVYPNAQGTDFNYVVSGSTSDCTVTWESDGAPDQLATFYEARLGSGTWQLLSKDPQSGEWSFQKRGDSSTVGRIRFLGHGTQTRIEMEVLTGQ